jgi:hypothetical protein
LRQGALEEGTMTQAESKRIEDEVKEGLRLIGLAADTRFSPDLPPEIPTKDEPVISYRVLIGNSTLGQ